MKTYWLSMHVPYACRDAGACCSAGWAIPVEAARVARLSLLRADAGWVLPAPGAPPEVAGVLARSETGHCVFHHSGCEIQRAFGHAALPTACQHFPREVLLDPRGVFVTLSHFCPTAADLLFDYRGDVEIVEGPPVQAEPGPEGLDARDVLPPLLAPGVLMDLDGYSAWERHLVRVLTHNDDRSAENALTVLEADLATVQRWRPGGQALADCIAALDGATSRVPADRAGGDAETTVMRRYLAARSFASWMPYQGAGVAAVLKALRFTLGVLRRARADAPLKEAIRRADLQVVHLMPRDALARV